MPLLMFLQSAGAVIDVPSECWCRYRCFFRVLVPLSMFLQSAGAVIDVPSEYWCRY